MEIVNDERGQGAAEYILLFGGVIVIAIAGLLIYNSYFVGRSPYSANEDLIIVRENLKNNGL
ncbi:MAG: class III signal peptide-containing protein [Methanobacteriaceae archaeon]